MSNHRQRNADWDGGNLCSRSILEDLVMRDLGEAALLPHDALAEPSLRQGVGHLSGRPDRCARSASHLAPERQTYIITAVLVPQCCRCAHSYVQSAVALAICYIYTMCILHSCNMSDTGGGCAGGACAPPQAPWRGWPRTSTSRPFTLPAAPSRHRLVLQELPLAVAVR